MANPNNVFLTGTQKVMDWYDQNAKTCFWSITDTKGSVVFMNADNDENLSRDHLEANVRSAEAAGLDCTFILRIHPKAPKEGYFVKNSPEMIITKFRPVAYETASMQPIGNIQMGYANNHLLGELNSLKSQIAALQMKLDEEDEEDEEDEPEEGGLAGFFKNPVMQNMLIQQLQGMFMPNTTKVTNVAGVLDGVESDQDQKIDEAIETLKQYTPNLGDDLILLAQIALNDPQQFKFLLKMLRS
jgi:hypothetical protein